MGYEYLVINQSFSYGALDDKTLNSFGKQGWLLIQKITDNDIRKYEYIFVKETSK